MEQKKRKDGNLQDNLEIQQYFNAIQLAEAAASVTQIQLNGPSIVRQRGEELTLRCSSTENLHTKMSE